jgi:hypothetical protein
MIINLNGLRVKGITNKLSKEIAKILLLRILHEKFHKQKKIYLMKKFIDFVFLSKLYHFIVFYKIKAY